MRSRRSMDLISGRVNGDGSIAAGEDFAVRRTGAGLYTITFPLGFHLLTMIPSPISQGSILHAHAYGYADRSVQVVLFNSSTGAAADLAFVFTAFGVQI